MRPKALVAWSSGKDSAWALHEVRAAGELDVVGALTTITEDFGRVSMHGVREDVVRAQHAEAELESVWVPIPYPCPNDVYEARMESVLADAEAAGVTHVVFGDLFLEDVRAYRERALADTGIEPVFPLWGRRTKALADEMLAAGLEAVVVCVDLTRLPADLAGRRFDSDLLSELPSDVDPCAEHGEFHTCVLAGPMLSRPVQASVGHTVVRDGLAYADLVLSR
jgi:uncharacterized protein (TIGR00290 family)